MLEKTIAHLGNLIAFPVISGDDNLAIVDYLQDRLEAAGAVCWRNCDTSGTRANLFATLGPLDGRGILLSGHTDVVPVGRQNWTSEPFKMDRRAGQLFGRGTCDMKGFVAVCVALAETISPGDLTRPLHFAFSYDEETGCLGRKIWSASWPRDISAPKSPLSASRRRCGSSTGTRGVMNTRWNSPA